MSEKVNLFFFPEYEEGVDEAEVRAKLAKTLQIDEEKVENWYQSTKPTIILKGVESDMAAKYVEAIRGCGAKCDLQPVGNEEWSLTEMTKANVVDYFFCPSCEHEEEIERGTKLEQCPECGLVIAKWEEKMKEEAEKEKIRRRLMRDSRLQGDRQAEMEEKRKELERLQRLTREIMEELGIKPPSKLWLFFEKYTISMSFAITSLIIIATGFAFRYADLYLDQLAHEELVAAAPSEDIKQIAPVISAAVQLQKNGNQQVVTEMADATEVLRGQQDSRKAIVEAAQQMMKGADAASFIANASKMALPKQQAQLAPGEVEPAPVNIDTIGGVTGLTGMSSFAPQTLNEISPPLLEHGHEQVLSILTEKKVIPDPIDPEAPEVVVEAIDELDGSMLVDLMSTLARDQEWDQYLLGHVRDYLSEQLFEEASELTNRIKNPVVRVEALGDLMVAYLQNEQPSEIKLLMARVRLDVDRIEDVDTKAMVMLNLGETLGEAGVDGQPNESINRVLVMANEASDMREKSGLHSRLAVAYMQAGNTGKAKQHFVSATNTAGQLSELSQRIDAFTKLAQRYYDARNLTLANEILSEASILAATELDPISRSTAFGKIAIAQGYLGDLAGARMSIENGGREHGKQQLIAKLAESLIGLGRYYEAMSLMETMENELEYNRLELRLSSKLIHEGREREARNRLDQGSPRVSRIYDLSERGLITSQYARLYLRLGQKEMGELLLQQAQDLSSQLTGRKAQVNTGIVALDWARGLKTGIAKEVLAKVTDSVVKDPIGNEVDATDRIIHSLLPKSLVDALVAEEEERLKY